MSEPPEIEKADEDTQLLYALVQDNHSITPVVLIGASALIPIPFLDDIAKAYLEKHLFRVLAQKEGFELSKEEAEHLTQDPSSGCCALGCLGSALLYPMKKILRKLFFFLEIKRSVDQSTTALAQAWLFQLSLKEGLWGPGLDLEKAHQLRRAIRLACRNERVKPLEAAVAYAFRGAKGTLMDFAAKFTQKAKSDEAELARTVDKLEADKEDEMVGITQRLAKSLHQNSDSHLSGLAQAYREALVEEASKPAQTRA